MARVFACSPRPSEADVLPPVAFEILPLLVSFRERLRSGAEPQTTARRSAENSAAESRGVKAFDQIAPAAPPT